jgi:hypothetical protein
VSAASCRFYQLGFHVPLAFTHDTHYDIAIKQHVFCIVKKEGGMPYSDFKALDQVHKTLGIKIRSESSLYRQIAPVKLSQWFIDTIKMSYTRAVQINTEYARQSLIVNNVLIELSQHINISFFLQNVFNVDPEKGLTGNPDAIISKNENQLYIQSPVVVLVEAKKSDLGSGYAQCIAEMEAARIFNEQNGNQISPVYGVVTDGVLWQFLSLENSIATIDSFPYPFDDGSKIVGILKFFVESSGLIDDI